MNATITHICGVPIAQAFAGLRAIQAIPFGHVMCPQCLGHKLWNIEPHPAHPNIARRTACGVCKTKGHIPIIEAINQHASFYTPAEREAMLEVSEHKQWKPVRVITREEMIREEKIKAWAMQEEYRRSKGMGEEA